MWAVGKSTNFNCWIETFICIENFFVTDISKCLKGHFKIFDYALTDTSKKN